MKRKRKRRPKPAWEYGRDHDEIVVDGRRYWVQRTFQHGRARTQLLEIIPRRHRQFKGKGDG